jgi:hypothetical protein
MSYLDIAVIKALKSGRVPRQGTLQLAVGRDAEIAEFSRMLDYVCGGFADVRFLRGDYGSGKTFICSVLRELAFERKMAVSIVNLSRDIPFGRRELVLSEILLGLRSAGSGSESALSEAVERWYDRHGAGTPLEENPSLADAIHNVSTTDPQLAGALRGHYRAYLEGNGALMEAALDFMRGMTIPPEARSALKLAGRLTPESAFRRLRAVLSVMREAGYPGLLVLVDEAETIQRLSKPQRDAAYTAIREIVDTCEEQFPYCLFVFAGTQALFEDEFRGVASYQPLYQRIKNTQVSSERDLRQPIIRLEELGAESLTTVAKRVRAVHASAYAWDAQASMSDRALEQFVNTVAARFGEIRQKPRGFLKALVDVLDGRQQGNGEIDVAQTVASINAVEAQDAQLDGDDDVVVAVA